MDSKEPYELQIPRIRSKMSKLIFEPHHSKFGLIV